VFGSTTGVVVVLEVCVAVRGDDGVLVDPGAVGVEALVEMIRAHPPGAPPAEYAVFGASVEVLESVEVVLGQVTALRAAAVHAVAEDTPAGVVGDQVADVLMMALGRSRRSGLFLREQALLLTHQPQVWAALWAGGLDVAKAGILARALHMVPHLDARDQERPGYDGDCERILASGLAYAAEHTAGQLDRHLKRLLAAVDPAAIVSRRRRALAERGVWIDHRGDGTADLTARLDSTHAEQVYAAIRAVALAAQRDDTARAAGADSAGATRCDGADGCAGPACRHVAGDCGHPGQAFAAEVARRPFDLRMADALVDLILTPTAASPVPGNRGAGHDAGLADAGPADAGLTDAGAADGPGRVTVSTQINVTIPIDSLAGLTDTPGTLSGFGVLPADLVRRLAAGDTRWRHILTDRATGAVLDIGTWSYRPPSALDRHVRTRDVTCRFPGCAVPARECDLDHLIPFPEGPTSAENLHALCRRHHRVKHDDTWSVEALPHSGLRWTSPHGTTRDTHPDTDHAHERLTEVA
jgi:hypothetical protein